MVEVQRFLDRRVAAADHRDRLAAIEKAIAGRAGRHALAAKGLFRGQPQVLRRGAGGDDQRIAGVLAVIAEQAKGTLAQIDPIDMVEHDLGVESFRMAAHALHQRGSLQMLDIARPIVHIGGGHELAALLQAGDQHRIAIRPGRIDGRGVACRSRPQDEETTVPDNAHV